jgi:hypothetical protein
MKRRGELDDPRAAVRAPFVRALNGIVARAAAGFALVALVTTVPLIVALPDAVHGAAHLLVPAGWLAYAAFSAFMLRGSAPVSGNPWAEAAEADPGLTRFAIVVSGFMVGGWLASVVAVVVHHHLSTPGEIANTIAFVAPSLLVSWALASWAFVRRCRHTLAEAETRANDLLRVYWQGVGR